MIIQIFENADQVAKAGANLVAAQLLEDPQSVLGLPTGSTPIGVYDQLIRLYEDGVISFAETTTFNLDEYLGLSKDNEQSYYHFMLEHLFSQVNIQAENINIPDGTVDDPVAECERYEQAIAQAGGMDLQLLGLGRNGHIGFNEPDSFFQKATHVVELTENTISANARFFEDPDQVPRQALSMGIGTIMDAAKIILVATGSSKAEAVKAMVEGNIDPLCQASILQLHPSVTILLDRDAAALLS
ncbi:MAG: glucosamine-6-phosphate deaminase [Oscillospiraceae bacterium]|nr:glucosamine-6-phosphate deaminase [Oscillospiraceae bacterium]MDD4368126.1 glucosamine-6-phosphate deaminase [Oscillospiraceae bacterium]